MNFEQIIHNDYVQIGVAFLVALYAMPTRMELPGYIRNLFNNDIFRAVFLSFLLIYRFEKAPHVALSVAIVFVLTLHYLSEKEVSENFSHMVALQNYVSKQQRK